jgi:hypothetical protein
LPKYTPKTKPFPHQSRATLAAARARNYMVMFEPRLGKSKVALDYSGLLALKGEVRRVLILAPRIALPVWERELQKHFPYAYHAETFEEEWDSIGVPIEGPTVQFFLAGREEMFRRTRDEDGDLLKAPKQVELERWTPDAIVVDESHEYKRPGGRGAQDLWRLVSRLRKARKDELGRPYVVELTGTPSAKGWRDLFAQFRIMDDRILGTSASDFDDLYCVYGVGPRKYTVIYYRNLSHLQKKIEAHSIACTAEEAGLAGKIAWQVLPCTLPPRVKEKYDELAETYVTEVDGQLVTAANPGVKRLRLLQITSGFLTDGTQIHRTKLAVAQGWLQLLRDQGEQVVIYCRFTAEVDAVAGLARKCGYLTSVVDGRTKQRDRTNAIAEFQRGPAGGRPKALVFQYQSGSRAIELTAAAEVLYTSLPDGWVDFWQTLNRVRGPNQKRPVRITAICASGTVDRSVLYGLRAKEDIHRLLLRDPKRFLTGGYVVDDTMSTTTE